MKISENEFDELCLLVQRLQSESIIFGVTRLSSDCKDMHRTFDLLIDKFTNSIDIFDN